MRSSQLSQSHRSAKGAPRFEEIPFHQETNSRILFNFEFRIGNF